MFIYVVKIFKFINLVVILLMGRNVILICIKCVFVYIIGCMCMKVCLKDEEVK